MQTWIIPKKKFKRWQKLRRTKRKTKKFETFKILKYKTSSRQRDKYKCLQIQEGQKEEVKKTRGQKEIYREKTFN